MTREITVRTGPSAPASAPTDSAAGGAAKLAGRVQADASCCTPRAGLGGKLRAVADLFWHCVEWVAPCLRRGQESPEQLQACIAKLARTLLSRQATPRTIEESLIEAAATTRRLRRAGGEIDVALVGSVLDTTRLLGQLQDTLREAEADALHMLPLALRGETVLLAHTALQRNKRLEAEKMLVLFATAVHRELLRRIRDDVGRAVAAAVEKARTRDAGEGIAETFHAAVACAVPLVRLDIYSSAAIEAEIDDALLTHLGALDGGERDALLNWIGTEDLARLKRAAASLDRRRGADTDDAAEAAAAKEAVAKAIGQEISARVEALWRKAIEAATAFRVQATAHRKILGEPLGPAALIDKLLKVAEPMMALADHCRILEVRNPSAGSPDLKLLTNVRLQVASALFDDTGAALDELDDDELGALHQALNALDHANKGALIPDFRRLRALFRRHRQAFGRPLAAVLDGLADAADPSLLLRDLIRLEASASALKKAVRIFERERASAPAKAEAAPYEEIRRSIGQWPEARRRALVGALRRPETPALVRALRAGAERAREVHEPAMAERLANMAALLESIFTSAGVKLEGTGEAASLSPEARAALRNLLGLELPARGPPTVRGGRLTPAQTRRMTQVLEARVASSSGQAEFLHPDVVDPVSLPVRIGKQEVSGPFYKDAAVQRVTYRVIERRHRARTRGSIRRTGSAGDVESLSRSDTIITPPPNSGSDRRAEGSSEKMPRWRGHQHQLSQSDAHPGTETRPPWKRHHRSRHSQSNAGPHSSSPVMERALSRSDSVSTLTEEDAEGAEESSTLIRPPSRGVNVAPAAVGKPLLDTHEWPGATMDTETLLQWALLEKPDPTLPENATDYSAADIELQVVERNARITAGFVQLVELWDEPAAHALTAIDLATVRAAFDSACRGDSPLHLPDGTVGRMALPEDGSAEQLEATFSTDSSGRPQVDIDYRIEAEMFVSEDDKPTLLARGSHVQVHLRYTLLEGELALPEPPSYCFDLRPSS